MPMSNKDRASKAARASHESRTPEERREFGRRAYLAGAVKAVVARAPELTPEQVSQLRTVFCEGGTR